MAQPLLEGSVVDHGADLQKLQDRIEELESDLAIARAEAARAKAQAERALRNLRRQLSPLHLALKEVFGEIEANGIGDEAQPGNNVNFQFAQGGNSKWDAIKQRNPGRIAEAIDVLLAHGEMNASQLASAMHMDRSNCSKNVVPKLASMGLLVRNGRMFSLKQL